MMSLGRYGVWDVMFKCSWRYCQMVKCPGIDTSKLSPNSCRVASTSAVQKDGLSLPDIMAAAGWSNATTFAVFIVIL